MTKEAYRKQVLAYLKRITIAVERTANAADIANRLEPDSEWYKNPETMRKMSDAMNRTVPIGGYVEVPAGFMEDINSILRKKH